MPRSLNRYFAMGVFQPLEKTITDWQDGSNIVLKKYILSKKEVPELRRLLDRDGLTEAHLKPSFTGVATAVKSRWRY